MITSLEVTNVLPGLSEWQLLKQQGKELISSGFLPSGIKTVEQFVAIVLKGRELGIAPMHALAHLHIINGKPCMSAELMLALIFRALPGSQIKYALNNGKECRIEAKRPNGPWSTFSFTIDDAAIAGLTGKQVWKQYPRAMCRSRCISEMARSLFPDAISGVSYTPEELGAMVNEDGEVIDVRTSDTDSQAAQTSETHPMASNQTTTNQGKAPVPFDPSNDHHIDYLRKCIAAYKVPDPEGALKVITEEMKDGNIGPLEFKAAWEKSLEREIAQENGVSV